MKSTHLITREEYNQTMVRIEALLQKSSQLGGFDKLSKADADTLARLSLVAEQYETTFR